MIDWVIAGAGFAGSVLARCLADAGDTVVLVERSWHIAGTAYDEYDDHGILVHRHGGHIFHSNSDDVVSFLSRFTDWRLYEHRVRASVHGQLVPMPINLDTVNQLYGLTMNSDELRAWFDNRKVTYDRIENAEQVVTSKVGQDLFDLLYARYTRKQWEREARDLGPQVTARIPVRTNRDDRYFTDRYQMTPKQGFTRLVQRMLDHPNISLVLGTEAKAFARFLPPPTRGMIWTGPIDEFFDQCLGPLPYRSMAFTYESKPSRCLVQPVATINYPNEHPYVRSTEFRHITGQDHDWTTIVYEQPMGDGPPFYPVPSQETEELLGAYKRLAERETPSVTFTGRLGSYRYYNMDQVIAQSLKLAETLLRSPVGVPA